MTYLATSINRSPVITDKAGVAIEDVRGRALKYDANGNIILCAAGESPLGIGIMTNDKDLAPGADVHIQIKDIGLVQAGDTIRKGAGLTVGTDGKFVETDSGACAIALEEATSPNVYIKARLVRSKKSTPSVPSVSVVGEEELTNAIAAAKDGEKITIAADTTVNAPLKIAEGQNITLHVPAGVTLTLSAGADNYGIVAKGTVTIEGDGDYVLTGYGFGTSINTDSKLIIKSGRFTAQGCDYIIGCFDGEVVIEGGEFDGEYCVVNNFCKTYNTDGKVTITGGTFRTNSEESYDVLGDNVEISGGFFSKPVDEKYCAPNAKPTTEPDENGYYTVI